VFDLDDTLYPYSAFVRSGFKAIATELAQDRGLSASMVFSLLDRARANGERGRELQALCARLGLPSSTATALLAVVREHEPKIHLPAESRRVLMSIRRHWRVGILTNGMPEVQRRKIEALGVEDLVDEVVLAAECGDGSGKPAPDGFRTVLERLAIRPADAVFVGDDLHADIGGAIAIGMSTIHVLTHTPQSRRRCQSRRCGVHVTRLRQVPAAATRLVPLGVESHVF
jgi:putative hydrolase of the HAD superfamily